MPSSGPYDGTMTATWRETQKANRRASLLAAAARLFAERGFASVSTVEIGEAAGVSGPALYRHFASKDAVLEELLLDASRRLLAGGQEIIAEGGDPADLLGRLIAFHLDFATTAPDIIRIQDRELPQLRPDANTEVRHLQRLYVQEWDRVLADVVPNVPAAERATRLLGSFGLLNSTPHSAAPAGDDAGTILAAMAWRSLAGS